MSNFWRYLDLPLINSKVELDLSWSGNCLISDISRIAIAAANPAAVPPAVAMPATLILGAVFQTNSTKLYAPRQSICLLSITLIFTKHEARV